MTNWQYTSRTALKMFISFDSVIPLQRIYPNKRLRDALKYPCARVAKCIISNRKKKDKERREERERKGKDRKEEGKGDEGRRKEGK